MSLAASSGAAWDEAFLCFVDEPGFEGGLGEREGGGEGQSEQPLARAWCCGGCGRFFAKKELTSKPNAVEPANHSVRLLRIFSFRRAGKSMR